MDIVGNHKVRPRATDVDGGAKYVGSSRSKMYEEMKAGRLKYVKIGSSRRLEYDELDRWFDAKVKASAI